MSDDARPDDDPPDARDVALLDALARALGVNGPADEAELVRRCEGLLTWVDVDSELAELLDRAPAELAGTRGSADATQLEFSIADGSCVIELSVVDGAVRGQVLGIVPERLALRVVTGVVEMADIDDVGAFTITTRNAGSARIEIELDAGRRIHTDWFVI